jgi:hypothetical protein
MKNINGNYGINKSRKIDRRLSETIRASALKVVFASCLVTFALCVQAFAQGGWTASGPGEPTPPSGAEWTDQQLEDAVGL